MGLAWCLSLITLIDSEIFLLSYGLICKFQDDDSKLLIISSMIGILVLSLLYIYAIKQKAKLVEFIAIINCDKQMDTVIQDQTDEYETELKQKEIKLEKLIKLPPNMPQFLIKASPSYYQVADFTKQFGNTLLRKLKLIKLMQKKAKIKQERKQSKDKQTPIKQIEIIYQDQNYQEECDGVRFKEQNNEMDGKQEIQKHKFNQSLQHEKPAAQISSFYSEKECSYDYNQQQNYLSASTFQVNENKSAVLTNQSICNIAQCLICFDSLPDSVIMDCGHGGICYKCAIDIWKEKNQCYLCRQPISQIIQIDVKGVGDYKPIIGITKQVDSEFNSDTNNN